MTRRTVVGATGASLVAIVAVVTVALAGGRSDTDRSPVTASATGVQSDAVAAATRFLDTYVADDGRVVRTDEGGDTVSEGQAYAMLVALAIDDRDRFATIWEWTRANLERPDGLLAWQWRDGQVVDQAAAADADVLAAWALLVAADRFDHPDFRVAGERIASAVLEHETTEADGKLVLVAGPWAQRSTPAFVNPGYFAPPAFSALADLTGDDAWNDLASTAHDLTRQLVAGDVLIPDWARVDTSGDATAHGGPGSGDAPGVFGLDAARLYVWLAISCDERDHALAAQAWSFFAGEVAGGIAMRYELAGSRLTDDQHPLTWVAAAATAEASGHGRPQRLLEEAVQLEERYPSYYGSAWVALGHILLTTDWLAAC